MPQKLSLHLMLGAFFLHICFVCPERLLIELYFLALGEVFDYLVAHGRMKEKEARAKFRQVSNKFLSGIILASSF
jgi:hypothetical protein